jgi:group I intron endonuclease
MQNSKTNSANSATVKPDAEDFWSFWTPALRCGSVSRLNGRQLAGSADITLAMLSVRDGWDHYLLILVCVYGLWVCGSILWEEYSPNFHSKKGSGENGQKPSEANDTARGNLRKLRSAYKNFRLKVSNLNGRIHFLRPMLCNVRNRAAKRGCLFCFHRALALYGEAEFDFEILETCEESQKFEREKYYIEAFDCASLKGFNSKKDPSERFNYKVSEATRARISEAGKGRVFSPESRAKMSDAHKGKRVRLGIKHTPEAKAKMSAAKMGTRNPQWQHQYTAEEKAMRSQAMQGKKIRLGKKLKPEYLPSFCASQKRRHVISPPKRTPTGQFIQQNTKP